MSAMRRLILMRHAKSSWSDPDIEDHDRPLNLRGRLAAPLMGAWLAERGLIPDAVLCSSSQRTQETWARVCQVLRDAPEPQVDAGLYHADPPHLLAALQAAPSTVQTLALIGHQPGIGAFLRRLAAADAPACCTRAYQKFPTAACAVLEFDAADWTAIGFGTGRFIAFAVPRELV
jgi:phosphohistidine phosphatase